MAGSGEDSQQSQEDSEGCYLELQSMVVAQGQKLDMLLDLWSKQSEKEKEKEKGMEQKAPEDGRLGTKGSWVHVWVRGQACNSISYNRGGESYLSGLY